LKLLTALNEKFTSTVFSSQQARNQSVIFTDKVVYRPNDVIFIEVLVVGASTKVPVAQDSSKMYNAQNLVSIEIRDSAGVRLASKQNYIDKGTVTFTHKIAANTSGGEYTIRV
jgi:uncharacterized protein YfaS (alpha-2-macroglobulin family)